MKIIKTVLLLSFLFAFASPSFASITRVHVPASSVPCSKGTNGSTALTCSTDVPPTVGDSLIVFVYAGGSGSSTTVTDNATGGSNTYTQQVQSTTGITGLRQYTAPIARTNAGTFTVTVTPSGSATLDVWFAEYAGVDTTQVDDTASGATGASGIRQCGSNDTLTTTNANDLIVAILSAGGATPLTVDSANSTYTMSALYTPLTLGYGGFMDKIESSTVSGLNLKFDGATGQSSTCAVGAYKASAPSATTFTFTGPSSGNVNSASTNFTVTPNANYTGTITITPSGAGSTGLSPTVLTFSNSSAAQTFTITPTVTGSITLTPTNNQSLTNPSNLTYTSSSTATVPGAPTIGTATAGNTQATVTFTAPASNGGATIDGYTVTSSPAGGTDNNAGSTSLSHVMNGLTNGTSYTFTVTAHNSVGNSSASSASNAVTPTTSGSGSQTPWISDIIAAGYTLFGNSIAHGNLTLDSTSNSAKGKILLNPTGNGGVGIGTANPTADLQVSDNTPGGSSVLNVEELNAGFGAVLKLNAGGSGHNYELASINSGAYLPGTLAIIDETAGAVDRLIIGPDGRITLRGPVGIGVWSSSTTSNMLNVSGTNGEGVAIGTYGASSTGVTAPSNGLIVSGNVGIGTSTPAYKLDVGGDINFTGTLRQNGTAFSAGGQWTTSGTNIYNNTSGNIGVGTTTPAQKLDVAGNIKLSGNLVSDGDICIGTCN